ncbi:MAG: hypothetical protein ACI4RU_06720, partial [Acutalibacteraceae bacterium]
MEEHLIRFNLCEDQRNIFMKQGDFGIRKIKFRLQKGEEDYILTNEEEILVTLKRSDGETISYKSGTEKSPVSIDGAEVTFRVTKWTTKISGSVFLEVSLLKEDAKITSKTIALRVSRALRTDEDYEDDESTDVLIELISLTKNLAQDIDRSAKNAQNIADAVRASYENGEFKLRYEDMT